MMPPSGSVHPRQAIAGLLAGDVLEVGPGAKPFPTAPGARVRYADRSVPGGRDRNWPELAGAERGPNAHYDVDIDVDGLRVIQDSSFDAVIASHVIEHLVNPLAALREFMRVLRPVGRLVVIVPDRFRTFDQVRRPTPFAHVLDEHRRHVTELSVAHIREFCEAIYLQPSIHPPQVRDWHNPRKLDDQRVELHRRRSIHVHCWSAEEFAAMFVSALDHDLLDVELEDVYFAEDVSARGGDEFGLVVRRTADDGRPALPAAAFAKAWIERSARRLGDHAARCGRFAKALQRDMRAGSAARREISLTLDHMQAQGDIRRAPLIDPAHRRRWRLSLGRMARLIRSADA